MSLSPISIASLRAPPVRAHGARPRFAWLPIADLCVDRTYQRDLTPQSMRRIEKIAAAFDWSCFTAPTVAKVAARRYAIIDGQHRTHAAALVGVTEVPCLIVEADGRRQAASFAAINGAGLRMSALLVYRAGLAAGEEWAVRIEAIARSCGVRILTYPVPADKQKPGDTMAVARLRQLLDRHGEAALRMVLTACASAAGDLRGAISVEVISGLSLLFVSKPLALETIKRVFAHIDLAEARAAARRNGEGYGPAEDFRAEIAKRLARIAARRAIAS